MLKASFESTKFLKFCWVIYIKVFFIDFITFSISIFDSKTSFLIVKALLPFHVNILHRCPLSRLECSMSKYGNMLESNQSPNLLLLLLLCQPCRYESWTLMFQKSFAILKFYPVLFEKIPSFVCLVFKNENKWILKLKIWFSLKTDWSKSKLYQAVTFRINNYL